MQRRTSVNTTENATKAHHQRGQQKQQQHTNQRQQNAIHAEEQSQNQIYPDTREKFAAKTAVSPRTESHTRPDKS